MSVFEDFKNEWQKEEATNVSGNLPKRENAQNIMNKLIANEQSEKRELKKGIVLGTLGMLAGIVFGIGIPVYFEVLQFNLTMLLGILLMGVSMLTFIVSQRKEIIDFDKHEGSLQFLQQIKNRITNREKTRFRNGWIYVILLSLGITLVNYSTMQQTGGEEYTVFVYLLPFLIGIIAMAGYQYTASKKQKNILAPLFSEIDELIAGFKE